MGGIWSILSQYSISLLPISSLCSLRHFLLLSRHIDKYKFTFLIKSSNYTWENMIVFLRLSLLSYSHCYVNDTISFFASKKFHCVQACTQANVFNLLFMIYLCSIKKCSALCNTEVLHLNLQTLQLIKNHTTQVPTTLSEKANLLDYGQILLILFSKYSFMTLLAHE